MKEYQRKINFSAGPSTISLEVLENIKDNLLNHENDGLSVLEMSHRSDEYMRIHRGLIQEIKELMNLDENWTIILGQGGASLEFDKIPLNFLSQNNKKAAYVIAGSFSKKAYQTAKDIYGDRIYIACDCKENNFTTVKDVKDWHIEEDTQYLHITTNNTVYGLKLPKNLDEIKVPIIADMSSNILSEEYDYNKFDMFYCGAQKNIGCAGLVLIAIKNSFLEKVPDSGIPSMFSYKINASKESVYNTPPTFSIYVAYENLKWYKKFGLENIFKRNKLKAKLLYDYIDSSEFYSNVTDKNYRSITNVIFRTKTDELDKKFIKEAKDNNIISIKGYSSVGGMRASLYNGMDLESVEFLINFMKEFENKNK